MVKFSCSVFRDVVWLFAHDFVRNIFESLFSLARTCPNGFLLLLLLAHFALFFKQQLCHLFQLGHLLTSILQMLGTPDSNEQSN